MKNAAALMQQYLSDGVVELRCLDKSSDLAKRSRNGMVVWSSRFDAYLPLRQAIIHAERVGMDIYHTVNPVALPATNAHLAPYERTAKDADISRIARVFFDFDPIRETGTAADPAQVEAAIDRARRCADWLAGQGWARPTLGSSGNGAHLLYRTELSPEERKRLGGLYAGLDARFGDECIGFDVTVRNPARIARTLGTINRKAGRRSDVLELSEEVTPGTAILATADSITPPKPKRTWVTTAQPERRGRYIRNLDVVGLFSGRGLLLQQAESEKFWVTCPWEHEHSSTGPTDTVIWAGEWPTFHCSHAHCQHRDIRDVIAAFGQEE